MFSFFRRKVQLEERKERALGNAEKRAAHAVLNARVDKMIAGQRKATSTRAVESAGVARG